MAAENAQFNGSNLVYILPKPTPDFCSGKMQASMNKPLAKIAPLSAPSKCYGTPPLKPPKREREEDDDKEIVRCKRRLDFAKLGLPMHRQSPAVAARRNERERKRVKHINETFDVLKGHLPEEFQTPKAKSKELSKVEILRGAIDYILTLEEMLTKTTGINFESQFSALIQASDNGDDDAAYPGTPSSSSSSQVISDTHSVASPAPSLLIGQQTPSQRVPELQSLDSPLPSVQTPSQLVPELQSLPSPSMSINNPGTPGMMNPQTPGMLPGKPVVAAADNYTSVMEQNNVHLNTTQLQHNNNSYTPVPVEQTFNRDLFSTDFHNLQCATNTENNNNNNLIMKSDLNANQISTKYVNNNNNNCDQYNYSLNLDCNYVPNVDCALSSSSSAVTGGCYPVTPNLCSPAPSMVSQSSGFGVPEDNVDFIDFASLLMGCDMK